MSPKKRPAVGSIVQIPLPNGHWAYGRVLNDGAIGIYKKTTNAPKSPPLGERDYMFVVGVYDDVLRRKWTVVGHDPSNHPEEDWPPPMKVVDKITGVVEEYHKGEVMPLREGSDPTKMEPVAAWSDHHIVDRIMREAEFSNT